jgi:hypothetical protein
MIKSFIDPTVTVSSPITRTGLGPVGLAYNITNLTLTANEIDTIQGISPAANPSFNSLTLTGTHPTGYAGLIVGSLALLSSQRVGAFVNFSDGTVGVSTVAGIYGGVTATKPVTTLGGTCPVVHGLYFTSAVAPASFGSYNVTTSLQTAADTFTTLTSPAGAIRTLTTTVGYGYRNQFVVTVGAGAAATKYTSAYNFAAQPSVLNNGGTIGTHAGFYCPDLTLAGITTVWGCAINTQSYFNANVAIGKATAPTVALDVVGAAAISTTLGVTGLSTLTGGAVIGDLTATRVPFAGASGRLVDDADMTFVTDTLTVTKGDIGFPYGSFSDSTTQTFASTTTAYPITFNTDEVKSQITHSTSTNPSRIYVDIAGTYLITYSACVNSPANNGHMNIWIRKNNADIARTNTTIELMELVQSVMTVTYILVLAANDYIELICNSQDTANCTIAATAVQTTPDVPASPSIICTINKISK